MVLPGFSSFRVPVQIRLFIAVAISMALLPVLWDTIYPYVQERRPGLYRPCRRRVAHRRHLWADRPLHRRWRCSLQAPAISMAIGFNAAPGGGIVETEQEGHITALITFTAVLLLFLTDFHHMVIASLVVPMISCRWERGL
jgi:flagellar biosynthetic protein FliR